MRVKGGPYRARKHKAIKKQAKGFLGARRRTIKGAKQGILNALEHAFVGRKNKKRNMRRLWITRLNAALRQNGVRYSDFAHAVKTKNIGLNRKVLSEIAITDPETFKTIVNEVTA